MACNPPGAKRVTEFIIKKCQTGHGMSLRVGGVVTWAVTGGELAPPL